MDSTSWNRINLSFSSNAVSARLSSHTEYTTDVLSASLSAHKYKCESKIRVLKTIL